MSEMDNFNPQNMPPPKVHGLTGYTDKHFGDQIWALWEKSELPDDAVVTQVTLAPYRGDRPVLAWREGRMWLPEGEVADDEDPDAAIERIALAQAGVLGPKATHLGHFRCRATTHSKTQPAGTTTYQVLYGVEVGGIADFPADSDFERRIVPQREMNQMLRTYYAAFRREYVESVEVFVLARHKELAQS